MKHWTHKYRYVLETPYPIERLGKRQTGVMQVDGPMTPSQIEALAKEMSNGLADNARLVEWRLIEVRR